MVAAAHSTKVCRTKVGQAHRQRTQCLLPLRSVTECSLRAKAHPRARIRVSEQLVLGVAGSSPAGACPAPSLGHSPRRPEVTVNP